MSITKKRMNELIQQLSGHLTYCPFCGSRDTVISENGAGKRYVLCLGCGARGPEAWSQESARRAWNERSD